jgi:diguanylate cyclase (GGDEF)-like protein
MIDADKFKEINDTYGHDTGDAVLVKIAHTLRSAFRSEDYVCRLGGDEFVVFMLHMDESHAPLIENKVNRINEVLANTSDGIPKISISVGVSFGSQADHVNVMIKHADLALYQMKEAGRAGCTFYHPQINDHPM